MSLCTLLLALLLGTPTWARAEPAREWRAEPRVTSGLPVAHLRMDVVNVLDVAGVLPDDGTLTPPGEAAPWLQTALPHQWAHTHPGVQGTMWYRVDVHLPDRPEGFWTVYLTRAVMNAQVWINGTPLSYSGSMLAPVTRNWYVPQIVRVPPKLWKPGDNVIHIRLASGVGSRDGLAAVRLGPDELVVPAYKRRYWWQVQAVVIANVMAFSLGAFLLLLWLRDRERMAVGYMGMSAMLSGTAILMGIQPEPLFDVWWWEQVMYCCSIGSNLMLCLFFFRYDGRRHPWIERFILLLMVLIPTLTLTALTHDLTVWFYAVIYTLAIAGIVTALCHVWRVRPRDGGWMVAGACILLPAGAHDVMLMLGSLPFDSIYWLYYGLPLLVGCVVVIVAGEQARAAQALRHLNQTLADQVSAREAELRSSFEQLAELQRSQAVSAERSRILKDMHDGVGAHLTTALRQLQGDQPGQPVDIALVTQTLKDSLDQLKLSIDSLSLPPGDVEGLLASWRFRLAPRLRAAGIELVWDVQRLPTWPAGLAPALRQIQYILFEGLSNVLQHSGATRLVLSARDTGHHIRISLIDNGEGWRRSGQLAGHGLQTMRTRAQAIGATLEWIDVPQGGLELRLSLPLPPDRPRPENPLSLPS